MERLKGTFGVLAAVGLVADVSAIALLALGGSSIGLLVLGLGAAAAGAVGLFLGGDPATPANRLRFAVALGVVVVGCGVFGATTHRTLVRSPGSPPAVAASPATVPPPSVSASSPRAPAPSRPCGTATIDNPQANDRVDRDTPVGGSATTCPGRELWTVAEVDGQYYVRPRDDLLVTDGTWRDPFGAIIPSETLSRPKLTLRVVETDAYGSEVIKRQISGDREYRGVQLRELTDSHMFILDSVTVINAEYQRRETEAGSAPAPSRRPAPDRTRRAAPAAGSSPAPPDTSGDPSAEPGLVG